MELFQDILNYISNINNKNTSKYWQKKEVEGEMSILLHDLKRENQLKNFLEYINLYELEHEDYIYIYNNFFNVYLKENVHEFLNNTKFFERYFERIKYINIKNNDLKLFETYKIFNDFIISEMKKILKVIFKEKNEMYYKIKEINMIINNYIIMFENLFFNQSYKDNSLDIFIKKEIYKNLKLVIRMNNIILQNNKELSNLFFDKKSNYMLFPYYFFNNLNNLYLLGEKNRNIFIKLETNILNFIEDIEKNSFLQLEQSNEKLLKFITIFTNIILNSLTEEIKEIPFNIKLNIEQNLIYLINKLLSLKNNFQLKDERIIRDYQYLNIKDKEKLLKINEKLFNLNGFNNQYFDKILKEYLYLIYEDENPELTFNFYITFNLILSIFLVNSDFLNIYVIEEKILKETQNQELYFKNLNITLVDNIYNLINLYRLLKIGFDYQIFHSTIEKIVFSIKNYNVDNITKYIKDLKTYFVLNDLFILHFIINNDYIITDDLIEIFNFESFIEIINNNKVFTLRIIDKISNTNNKKIKLLLKEILNNNKQDKEIIKSLKNIGINYKTNILEENFKIF